MGLCVYMHVCLSCMWCFGIDFCICHTCMVPSTVIVLILTFGSKVWQLQYFQYITHALYICTTRTVHVSTVTICILSTSCILHLTLLLCKWKWQVYSSIHSLCHHSFHVSVNCCSPALLGTYMMCTTCRPPPGLCWQDLPVRGEASWVADLCSVSVTSPQSGAGQLLWEDILHTVHREVED